MPLSSMTGFSRASGRLHDASWTWELKSVNGKSLDLRLRVPPGYDHLELAARARLSAAFKRGSLQVNLALQQEGGGEQLTINHEVLDQYVALAKALRKKLKSGPVAAESLLAMRGVVEAGAKALDDAAREEMDNAMLASLGDAITALARARQAEGAALGQVLGGQLDQISGLVAQASANPARQPEAVRARLAAQISELMGMAKFDESRLAQEAALLFTKADIKEEIDRLNLHVAAARALLKSPEPVGRKLDFLAQEFNREANTLCSKANDPALTAVGLELKSVIDQMREQVQNLE